MSPVDPRRGVGRRSFRRQPPGARDRPIGHRRIRRRRRSAAPLRRSSVSDPRAVTRCQHRRPRCCAAGLARRGRRARRLDDPTRAITPSSTAGSLTGLMSCDLPLVRVVVLNFDGGDMTLECLDSLLATDWPSDRLEIVMVDNGSLDDVVERVATDERYRSVRVLRTTGQSRLRRRLQPRHRSHRRPRLRGACSTTTPPSTPAGCGRWCRSPSPTNASVPSPPRCCSPSRFHGIEFEVPDASHIVKGEHATARRSCLRRAHRRRTGRRPSGVRRRIPRRRTSAAERR